MKLMMDLAVSAQDKQNDVQKVKIDVSEVR